MAVTWNISLRNVDVAAKRADVQATRTDDQIEGGPRPYTYQGVPIGTAEERVAILNQIKSQVEKDALAAAQVSAFVDTLEADGKSNLENWELTR